MKAVLILLAVLVAAWLVLKVIVGVVTTILGLMAIGIVLLCFGALLAGYLNRGADR